MFCEVGMRKSQGRRRRDTGFQCFRLAHGSFMQSGIGFPFMNGKEG